MNSTDFLFATPKFLSGVARILDFGSTLTVYNDSETTEEADYRASYSDWFMVAQDMKEAMDTYDRNTEKY